jgi:large subunit ribosomal protein L35
LRGARRSVDSNFAEIGVPKLKTHKATARRMQVSGSGKLMRTRQGKSHLRRNKSSRIKRDYDEMFVLAKADEARVRKLMPYAK